MEQLTLWLRQEARKTERRTPLLPEGAKSLIDAGIEVVVEKSEKRIFSDTAYEAAGCRMTKAGAWENAPKNTVVLGLKELPETPEALIHTHIYFAHAYKGQKGWQDLLNRFLRGGGTLLDIEYMTDERGRRVVAFGYWAGYMGAALALIQLQDRLAARTPLINSGLTPFLGADALDDMIRSRTVKGKQMTALVIGAGGRSGKGATEILERHGVKVTKWGREETAKLDRAVILDHDMLINCAFVADMIPPFLTTDHITGDQRLSVISDVSCDPKSAFNPLPLYSTPTCWDTPAIAAGPGLDLIAIDNLPSLLPVEASTEFAGLLMPHLASLPNRHSDPVWSACCDSFRDACASLDNRKAS